MVAALVLQIEASCLPSDGSREVRVPPASELSALLYPAGGKALEPLTTRAPLPAVTLPAVTLSLPLPCLPYLPN